MPPNPRYVKYATRQSRDDEALEIIERLIEAVHQLQQMGDRTEDWERRLEWLHTQVGRLWRARGLYPGMTAVLEHLGATALIPWFKARAEAGEEHDAKAAVFAFFDDDNDPSGDVNEADGKKVRRRWKLLGSSRRTMISDILVRFDLQLEQLSKILGADPESFGITASAAEICENPYVLAEQFVGDDPDDVITFSRSTGACCRRPIWEARLSPTRTTRVDSAPFWWSGSAASRRMSSWPGTTWFAGSTLG